MTSFNDYQPYMCSYGLVHDNPGVVSGNGIRYTTEAIASLARAGFFSNAAKRHFQEALDRCETEGARLRRHPTKRKDYQGPDDFIARLHASKILGDGYAIRFLVNGRVPSKYVDGWEPDTWKLTQGKLLFPLLRLFGGPRYVYNNRDWDGFHVGSWLGRQPWIVAHAKICAGEPLSTWDKFTWCGNMVVSAWKAKPTSEDCWVLAWHMSKAAAGVTGVVSIARAYWMKVFKKKVPEGGIGQVLYKHFKHAHPNALGLGGDYG